MPILYKSSICPLGSRFHPPPGSGPPKTKLGPGGPESGPPGPGRHWTGRPRWGPLLQFSRCPGESTIPDYPSSTRLLPVLYPSSTPLLASTYPSSARAASNFPFAHQGVRGPRTECPAVRAPYRGAPMDGPLDLASLFYDTSNNVSWNRRARSCRSVP